MRWVAQTVSDSLYKRADRLIAMSVPLQKRLIARTGKPEKDVAVISAVLRGFLRCPRHDPELEARFSGRFNLVFTGTFTPAQSLDMVLRAVLDARAAGGRKPASAAGWRRHEPRACKPWLKNSHAGDAVTFMAVYPQKRCRVLQPWPMPC